MKIDLTTPAKRAKLAAGKEHWMPLAGLRGGVTLGWRDGSWIAKNTIGTRGQKVIGKADDAGVVGGVDFKAIVPVALAWAETKRHCDPAVNEVTVRSAVEAYIVARTAVDAHLGGCQGHRLRRHVFVDAGFSAIPLSELTVPHILAWRAGPGIPKKLKPSTVNRILSDLRAALNHTRKQHVGKMPNLAEVITVGTENLHVSEAEKAREYTPLENYEVKRLIEEAFAIGDDFGRLVMLLAATGARHSQIAKLRVRDLFKENGIDYLHVPGDRKGRAKVARDPQNIAIAPEVRAKLAAAVIGRGQDEPLLTEWKKGERVAWDDTPDKAWKKAMTSAGLAVQPPYVLRHTSCIRHLLDGLAIAVVAKLHFTSAKEIEATYSRQILKASDVGLRGALRL